MQVFLLIQLITTVELEIERPSIMNVSSLLLLSLFSFFQTRVTYRINQFSVMYSFLIWIILTKFFYDMFHFCVCVCLSKAINAILNMPFHEKLI